MPSVSIADESLVLPSSLRERDLVVDEYIEARTKSGSSSSVCLPSWKGPFDRRTERENASSIRICRDVARARHLVALVNLDLVADRGPFVLDLAVRYLAPLDRARILASPHRELTIARINRVIRFDSIVLSKTINETQIWLETSDPIAGELVALALSETSLRADRRYPSPWEDPLLQRATDLDLGARYSGDIRLDRVASLPDADLREVLLTLHLRIGIDIPTISDHY